MNGSRGPTQRPDRGSRAAPEARDVMPGLPAGAGSGDRFDDDRPHQREETARDDQGCEDESESAVHVGTDVQEQCQCEARYAPPHVRSGE